MANQRRSERKEPVVAQVFLRSVSGRSPRELVDGPLPADLAPFRPTEAARAAVTRFFQRMGFNVHRDDMGLSLSIEASPAVCSKVFGISSADLTNLPAHQTIRLRPPTEIQQFVEDIIVTPKPEFF